MSNANIGSVIKTLRREKNLTQEALAELLSVTPQAVSKWEIGSGMPDVSQIVPIARVLGVTTDVLFGLDPLKSEEEIAERHEKNFVPYEIDNSIESKRRNYYHALETVRDFPTNYNLMSGCIADAEVYLCEGIEEGVVTDEEKREVIAECERQYSCIMNYCKNIETVLYANLFMIYLYSGIGEFEKAMKFTDVFPNSIFTKGDMLAWIYREQKSEKEAAQDVRNVYMYIKELISNSYNLARVYEDQNRLEDAVYIHQSMIDCAKLITNHSDIIPFSNFDILTCYVKSASIYLKLGDIENMYKSLEAAYEQLVIRKKVHVDNGPMSGGHFFTVDSPFLENIEFGTGYLIQAKNFYEFNLQWKSFDAVRNEPRFIEFCEKVKALI